MHVQKKRVGPDRSMPLFSMPQITCECCCGGVLLLRSLLFEDQWTWQILSATSFDSWLIHLWAPIHNTYNTVCLSLSLLYLSLSQTYQSAGLYPSLLSPLLFPITLFLSHTHPVTHPFNTLIITYVASLWHANILGPPGPLLLIDFRGQTSTRFRETVVQLFSIKSNLT